MVPFKDGISVFWRPQDPNSFIFNESILTDTSTSVSTIQGDPFIVIGFGGCASNANYIIEYICHYEGYIDGGNSGAIEVSKNPATSVETVLKAADVVFPTNSTVKMGTNGGFDKGQSAGWSIPKVISGVADTVSAGIAFGDTLLDVFEALMIL
jgi:hypothetical protein